MSVEGVSSLLMTSSAPGLCAVPVEHLDYSYIQQCGDLKYLEKILHMLRSGTEGVYPHLTEFCEKRMETLEPRHRALRKETPPATAASFTPDQWKHITDDLQTWQREITEREQQLIQTPTVNTHTLPPVHNRTLQRPTNTKTHRKPAAVPREYGDWDRFDVDAECAKIDEAIDNNGAPAVINTPHTHITHHMDTLALTQQEKCVLATREREKGNEAFRAREWDEAIVYYTRSLCILPTVAGFNNRAQVEIKLHRWTDALRDCDAVLNIETNNCKALLRRATVYTHLGNLQAALEDLTNVLQSEPHNITAQKLLQEVNEKINTELSHTTCSPNQPVRGRKILIQEVDEETVEETRNAESAGVDKQAQRDTGRETERQVEIYTDRQTERQADRVRQCVDAAAVRSEGNELYMKGQYGDAAEKYTHGITTLTQLGVYSEEEVFFLYCNRAACFLKMGQSSECVSDCSRALQLKPFSVKSLLRRAMAYEILEQFRLAYVDYRTVQQIHNTHSVQQHVNRLTKVLIEEDGSDWRMKHPDVPVVPLSARHDGSETLMSQPTPTTHTPPNTETPPTTPTPPNTESPPTTHTPPNTETPLTTHTPPNTETPPTTPTPPNTESPPTTHTPPNTETPLTTHTPPNTETPLTTPTPPNTESPPTTHTPPNTETPLTTHTPPNRETPPTTHTPPNTESPPTTHTPPNTETPLTTHTPPNRETPPTTHTPPNTESPPTTHTPPNTETPPTLLYTEAPSQPRRRINIVEVESDVTDDDDDDNKDNADNHDDDDGDEDNENNDEDGTDDDDNGEDGDYDVTTSSPDNVFMFGQALHVACRHGDLVTCARLLKSVSPHTLPQHISTQLDTHTLRLIIHTLDKHILPTDPGLVYLLLTHLHTIHRFTMVLMLMDSEERRRITQLFECLCAVECDYFTQENINNLANKFK